MKASEVPRRCFQGILPSLIATCSPDGIPNITYLSQVFYVDAKHVALSCQFFNKTKQNALANPRAMAEVLDPTTLDAYRLELRFDHEEREGPLFEQMSVRIDVIASHTGMTGVFKLLSADVYEVVRVEKVVGLLHEPPPGQVLDDPPVWRSEIHALQLVSQRAARAKDLDSLLSTVLETLEEAFGFAHAMVLLLDEAGTKLYAVASRGYEGGIGAEVGLGEGLIGTVARERCILRVAGVGSELRYGRAIRASVHRAGGGKALTPEIPLPGLVDAQSQMALPLVAGDRLVGVIALESKSPGAFEEWHEPYLEIVATQVALAIESTIKRGREAEIEAAPSEPAPPPPPCSRTRRFRFHRNDECVFVDDEYLIRGVPGRILWKLLKCRAATGRTDYTNRELRVDPSLGLPAVRDNLESRLVLLRKRLEQKCPELTLAPSGRGQFRLDSGCTIELEEVD